MKLTAHSFRVGLREQSDFERRIAPLVCDSFMRYLLPLYMSPKCTVHEMQFHPSRVPMQYLVFPSALTYHVHAVLIFPESYSTLGARAGLKAHGWTTSIMSNIFVVSIDKDVDVDAFEAWWFTKIVPIRDEVFTNLGVPEDVWDNAQVALRNIEGA